MSAEEVFVLFAGKSGKCVFRSWGRQFECCWYMLVRSDTFQGLSCRLSSGLIEIVFCVLMSSILLCLTTYIVSYGCFRFRIKFDSLSNAVPLHVPLFVLTSSLSCFCFSPNWRLSAFCWCFMVLGGWSTTHAISINFKRNIIFQIFFAINFIFAEFNHDPRTAFFLLLSLEIIRPDEKL